MFKTVCNHLFQYQTYIIVLILLNYICWWRTKSCPTSTLQKKEKISTFRDYHGGVDMTLPRLSKINEKNWST